MQLINEGHDGLRKFVYHNRYHDGRLTATNRLSYETLRGTEMMVRIVGTGEKKRKRMMPRKTMKTKNRVSKKMRATAYTQARSPAANSRTG